MQITISLYGTFWKAIGISLWCHLKCGNVIGQSNCLLPILGVSLAGIRRSLFLILPNVGPWNKLRTLSYESRSMILYGSMAWTRKWPKDAPNFDTQLEVSACLLLTISEFMSGSCSKGVQARSFSYYDSQLSMTLGKFGDKVSVLKLPCCQGQLPLFPRLTFRALTLRAMSPPKSTNGKG